ncbi:MAG: HAD hydrolase-like protein [Rickettsiales bacterium]|nr:HAD hydrolase-like protein [Rickettsiales bacterium]
MLKIKNNDALKEVLLSYDMVLFDFMGVVSNGSSLIDGVDNTMSFLVKNNKIVSFVSNVPDVNTVFKNELSEIYNLNEGIHYNFIVTSGDVRTHILKNGLLKTRDNKVLKKFYIFGKVVDYSVFNNIAYEITDDIEEADFIYVAYPQLSFEEYNATDDSYKKYLFESTMYEDKFYDSTNLDVFVDKIKFLKNYNLPMFSDCCDLMAMQKDKNSDKINYVIRQGSITSKYKELGGEVINVSKPSSIIYDYAFKTIENKLGVNVKNKKILMIGDTVDTDILGATNATRDLNMKVDGMLTLCGISGKAFKYDVDKINDYCLKNKLNLHYLVDNVGISNY